MKLKIVHKNVNVMTTKTEIYLDGTLLQEFQTQNHEIEIDIDNRILSTGPLKFDLIKVRFDNS